MAQEGKRLDPPELGTYRYGTMVEAAFAPSKMYKNPDVKLTGDWEGEGQGHWYANWKAVTALCRAGMLTQLSGDGKQFQVRPGTRCCVYRERAGGESRAHNWFAVAYDEQGEVVTLPASPDPVEPQNDAAQSAPPPQQTPPAGQQPPPPAQQESAADPKARAGAKAAREREMVSQVDAAVGMTLAIAAYHHVRIFGQPLADLDEPAVQDTAACAMIRLEKLGYDSHANRARSYLKRLRQLEHSLFPDRCPPWPDEEPKADGKGTAKKGKRKSKTAPKEEPPEPAPVSTVPGAQYDDFPDDVVDDGGPEPMPDDDLPF